MRTGGEESGHKRTRSRAPHAARRHIGPSSMVSAIASALNARSASILRMLSESAVFATATATRLGKLAPRRLSCCLCLGAAGSHGSTIQRYAARRSRRCRRRRRQSPTPYELCAAYDGEGFGWTRNAIYRVLHVVTCKCIKNVARRIHSKKMRVPQPVTPQSVRRPAP